MAIRTSGILEDLAYAIVITLAIGRASHNRFAELADPIAAAVGWVPRAICQVALNVEVAIRIGTRNLVRSPLYEGFDRSPFAAKVPSKRCVPPTRTIGRAGEAGFAIFTPSVATLCLFEDSTDAILGAGLAVFPVIPIAHAVSTGIIVWRRCARRRGRRRRNRVRYELRWEVARSLVPCFHDLISVVFRS